MMAQHHAPQVVEVLAHPRALQNAAPHGRRLLRRPLGRGHGEGVYVPDEEEVAAGAGDSDVQAVGVCFNLLGIRARVREVSKPPSLSKKGGGGMPSGGQQHTHTYRCGESRKPRLDVRTQL